MEKIECPHVIRRRISPRIDQLIAKGKLQASEDGVYCDDRIPISLPECNGNDISCVGPKDNNCPHPTEAIVIYIVD